MPRELLGPLAPLPQFAQLGPALLDPQAQVSGFAIRRVQRECLLNRPRRAVEPVRSERRLGTPQRLGEPVGPPLLLALRLETLPRFGEIRSRTFVIRLQGEHAFHLLLANLKLTVDPTTSSG